MRPDVIERKQVMSSIYDKIDLNQIKVNECVLIWLADAIIKKIYKVGDRSRGRPEGSFFNSYYTKE